MAYTPDPTDATRPQGSDPAGAMAAEFRALKAYLAGLISSGSKFNGLGSYRNMLDNGAMQIAQRGTTVAVSSGASILTLDRWYYNSVGAAGNINRVVSGPEPSNYSAQLSQSAGATASNFFQRVEAQNCKGLLSGNTVTVSGYYFTSSLSNPVPSVNIVTPSAVDSWGTTLVSIGSAVPLNPDTTLTANQWVHFTNQFTLTGAGTNGVQLTFAFGSGIAVTTAVYFTEVQMERGPLASSFEQVPVSIDLAKCQRQYQLYNANIAGYAVSGTTVNFTMFGKITMRVNPTLILQSNTVANTGVPTVTIASNAGDVLVSAATSGTGGYSISVTVSASAEL